MATATSSADTATTAVGGNPSAVENPVLEMDFPPLYSLPAPPPLLLPTPEQQEFLHAFPFPPPPSLPPYIAQFHGGAASSVPYPIPFAPPFFFEPPVVHATPVGWYDYALAYPIDLWSHGATTAAALQGVGGPINAAVASAVGSSWRRFPLTLDLNSICWESHQNLQQQQQWGPAKAARSNRRIARQRSAPGRSVHPLHRISSGGSIASASASSKASSSAAPRGRPTPNRMPIPQPNGIGLQRLRYLLQKELQNSDVSPLGRIILPKKESEANLPVLAVKEGIALTVRDVFSTDAWRMRFRFWPNNKSRMYVLENTGDFVQKYNLKRGDLIALYQDDNKQIFIYARKAEGLSSPLSQAADGEEDESIKTRKTSEHKRSGESGGSSSNTNANVSAELPVEEPSSSTVSGYDASTTDFTDFDLSQFERFPSFDECDLSLYDFKMEDEDDAGAGGKDNKSTDVK